MRAFHVTVGISRSRCFDRHENQAASFQVTLRYEVPTNDRYIGISSSLFYSQSLRLRTSSKRDSGLAFAIVISHFDIYMRALITYIAINMHGLSGSASVLPSPDDHPGSTLRGLLIVPPTD
jgi:hypothetical protein